MIGAIWLIIKALGLPNRLARAGAAGWASATRNPYPAALALCAALLALCWHVIEVKDRTIARLRADKAHIMAAQSEATRIAAEALHHQRAVYQAKANEADHAYQTQLANAQPAADVYIVSHRLRATDVARGAGAAIASAASGSAATSPPVPADAIMVSSRDVHACTDAVTYAIAAHDWASTIDPLPRNSAE
ncbi:hypothetical protein [Novosphingobium sp.]|uniref:hypothetical protein n=1 Tax=Novosphingobium sp. TaxID=1874826 RepID=UPI0033404505